MSTEHEATQMLQRPDEELLRAAAQRRVRRQRARTPGASDPIGQVPTQAPPQARILPVSASVAPLKSQVFDPVKSEDVELGNALLGVWPRAGFGEMATPVHVVREVLEEVSGVSGFRFDFHGLRILEQGADWPDVGHAGQWRFELPPSPDYGIMSVDQSLIDPMLGAMLAEHVGGMRRTGSMSARDHGLFSFVILRVIDGLVACHGMPPFVMAVEPPSREEALNLGRHPGGVVEAVFLVSTATSAGFVRVFLPAMMVRTFGVWRQTHPLSWEGVQLGALAKSRVAMPVSVARMMLGQVDAWSVEVGDVLLPPEHGIGEAWAHTLGIQPGQEGGARLHTDVRHTIDVTLGMHAEHGQWTCTIQTIQISESHTQGEMMSEANQGAQERTSDLLREVSVELEVRLAGVTMSVEEIASMQVGQVIGLGVPIGEPVELRAGGQRLGLGELVNVEGKLGVRVLSRQ